ncbi:PIN domain-containing protein [Pseudovibrio sp. JE062]|uniref:PIN domain-containing protein n=1 Tax=Pseudovibrio sp. JE062 TaxID=439495 RepID=UPI000186BCF2|nr:PIN domain-containing protein [Pseudovibrio sp. JE062]EEA93872.1 conserved hypothetical protein [Pseudovibrio sp. JE062]
MTGGFVRAFVLIVRYHFCTFRLLFEAIMKGLFPEFDPGADKDFQKIWKEALFVFDTNVLLNLYRYQKETRDQLIDVIEKISTRIWIPHHVALEFQRNRLVVIADQHKRFAEVRKTVEKAKSELNGGINLLQLEKRHSLIDPKPLISGFEKLTDKFLRDLEETEKKQQKLNEEDPVKNRLDNLFDGRVGDAPKNQKEIDDLYSEGDKRFAKNTPPGYLDASKDKKGPDEHLHGDILYKRKYGDYVVWNQLLAHANTNDEASVIFVTDDSKEDWWWVVNASGKKTIGPRPELVSEALSKGNISSFLMYKSEDFLRYANKFLEADVSNEALEEVRDVAEYKSSTRDRINNFKKERIAEDLVYRWLHARFPDAVTRNRFPNFIIDHDGMKLGYEVKFTHSIGLFRMLVDKAFKYSEAIVSEYDLESIFFVFMTNDPMLASQMKQEFIVWHHDNGETFRNIRVFIAYFEDDSSEDAVFTLMDL